MKFELCAYSVDACRVAARLGVDRVELCASPAEGGVTPSLATIERVAAISNLDLSVMIRPRGGDFLYSDEEFQTMLQDITHARKAGATGVVLAHNHPGGLALPSGNDISVTRKIYRALRLIDIQLCDHIVVADGDFVSMLDSGMFADFDY